MNEEIYEGTPAKEDVLIGTDSGFNRYRRPDGSIYVSMPSSVDEEGFNYRSNPFKIPTFNAGVKTFNEYNEKN